MKNTDCPIEYLSGILAKDYKVKVSTTQYAKSKSKYSSLNDEAWSGHIKKRLTAVYVEGRIHIKLECSYAAEIAKAKDGNELSVYYHKRGNYKLGQVDLSMLGHYRFETNHYKAGRYVPIYDKTLDPSEYVDNSMSTPLSKFADAAELALSGQFMPEPLRFANRLNDYLIESCHVVDIVTIRENGLITNDLHDPSLKPYFLMYLYIPNGLPLVDIGKGHLAVVTDGKLYYSASRHLDKHIYLVQKDIKELSNVGGNIDKMASEAISIYLNNINEGIPHPRKLPTWM